MILVGDSLVPYDKVCKISSIEEIKKSLPNSTLVFKYDEKILTYCFNNSLVSAVIVDSVKEAIYANALKSQYIICQNNLAIKLQKIAENYMFDAKILSIIDSNEELEDIALNEIDGVIYSHLLE